MNDENISEATWTALPAVPRRVLGVLVEKAKTTPDAYPMTVNALRNGCNQKNNRSPQMQLSADEVEEALDQLRDLGAVAEIQGDGRATKYRHKAYQWLGVEKVELAVLAELLLRGEQTVGELRGRAARMETNRRTCGIAPDSGKFKRQRLVAGAECCWPRANGNACFVPRGKNANCSTSGC